MLCQPLGSTPDAPLHDPRSLPVACRDPDREALPTLGVPLPAGLQSARSTPDDPFGDPAVPAGGLQGPDRGAQPTNGFPLQRDPHEGRTAPPLPN